MFVVYSQQNPDIPPQHQERQPGRESVMQPPPESRMARYSAARKLTGRKALITGGDSGIGRAVAVGFAKEGADVAILYLEEDEDARATRRLVEAEGQRCTLIAGDVSREEFCREAVAQLAFDWGAINILVNNAGQQYPVQDFEELPMPQMEKIFRTNVFSMFYLTQAVLPHMTEGDAIVNTTSVTAYKGHEELVDYAATKGAILAFTRALSQQLVKRGIRVNAVAPGPIWTPLIPASFPTQDVAQFGKSTPMGRPGQPDEVAPCYIFLASADASYMTGQVLHPNGGVIVNA